MIGEMYPPAGGFWELGGFRGQNLWSGGTVMAPFDQRVCIYEVLFSFLYFLIYMFDRSVCIFVSVSFCS